nr:MAG TPA_asm: N-terminal domain of DPF2/REQ [Caudoviricetes sp.]
MVTEKGKRMSKEYIELCASWNTRSEAGRAQTAP